MMVSQKQVVSGNFEIFSSDLIAIKLRTVISEMRFLNTSLMRDGFFDQISCKFTKRQGRGYQKDEAVTEKYIFYILYEMSARSKFDRKITALWQENLQIYQP